ncbi:DMT family transporter [Marinobacterium arenosum]|uniref:DMT family transporter n=1 Tax=Marinobacterium arenosum TaxID=2862496 RepID=UPI001C96A767|nr:DMT family transporter [Marinobacterium arenosum]MBY4677034.1 DMT family transporter [Marinobacterium arenosum]
MSKQHLDGLAIGLLTLLCLVFGLQQIAVKLALDDISSLMQGGLRSIGATALLCGWMVWQGERIRQRDGAELWGLLAGLLFSAEFALLYWALEYTGAARVTVFLYTSPFVVALGAQLFIPGEQLRRTQLFGLLCAFAGVVLAFADGLGSGGQLLGDLLAIGAAILWGATTVVIKATPLSRQSASRVLLYQLALSALLLPLASWLFGEPGVERLHWSSAGALAFQTVCVAFAAYLSWFWLMRHYPASRIATFSFLTPLFGVLLAWWLLDEPLSANFLAALALVAAGIYLVNKPKARLAAAIEGKG